MFFFQGRSNYLALWIVLKIITLIFVVILIIMYLITIIGATDDSLAEQKLTREDLIIQEVSSIIGLGK